MQRRNRLLIGILICLVLLVGSLFGVVLIEGEYLTEDWMITLYHGIPYFLTIIVAICIQKSCNLRIPGLRPKFSHFSSFFTLWGVILMFAMQVLISPLVHLIPDIAMRYVIENRQILMQSGFYPQFTAIILAPILQEWVFRGVFQGNIERRFGAIWGIVLSGLLFGFTYLTPQESVYMTGAGIAIAAIYYTTKSLSTVIWIHILFNGIHYLVYLLFDTDYTIFDALDGQPVVYILLWAFCAIIVLLTVWWVWRKMDYEVIRKKIEKI